VNSNKNSPGRRPAFQLYKSLPRLPALRRIPSARRLRNWRRRAERHNKPELSVSDWREIRGAGVEANIQHPTSNIQHPMGKARLGSLRWLKESGVDLAAGEKFIAEWSGQGATIVGLAVDQSLAGLFAVKDTVKPGARDVVEKLHRQNLKTFLLTGDNALTAASIGAGKLASKVKMCCRSATGAKGGLREKTSGARRARGVRRRRHQ